jgi:hypothetical protein
MPSNVETFLSVLASLGELPPSREVPFGWGLIASGNGPAAGAPFPALTQLNIHGPPAIVQPYQAEDDQPYVCAYDRVKVVAEDLLTHLPVQDVDKWLIGQCTLRIDGKFVSTYGTDLSDGVGFFGYNEAISTLNLRENFYAKGDGIYHLPRIGLFSNVGNQPSNRSVVISGPTPGIGAYPAAPGNAVNVTRQVRFFVFIHGLWAPMTNLGVKTDPMVLAQKLEVAKGTAEQVAAMPRRIRSLPSQG